MTREEQVERQAERGPDEGRRWQRGLRWGPLVAALLVAGGLGFGHLERTRLVRDAQPRLEGRLPVAGLGQPVEIVRDRQGVPHVRASDPRDAWLSLGFVHAQDRLAQMLWLRSLARGRSAERLGEAGLPADRLARTLDLTGLAAADLARCSPSSLRVLQAYAAGVNARIARLPPGWGRAHGESPLEPWSPVDSLALMKLHSWGLGGSLDEILVLDRITRELGGSSARPFFPAGVGVGASERSRSVAVRGVGERSRPLAAAAKVPVAPLRHALGLAGRGVGSSAFAVSGRRARRRRPLLAADAHFEARFPASYYEADLQAADLEVAGATLPGIPAFWIGFTPRLAWAATHYPAVVADLATVTLHREREDVYHDGRRWRPLAVREETLAVRGGEAELLRVRSTGRGPLVEGLLPLADQPLELRWAGAQPGDPLAGLLALPRAPDFSQGRRALALHREPVLAVVLVAASGAGGVQVAGSIPDRELASGAVPVPGRDSAYDWDGFLAPEVLPRATLGSERLWVVAADGSLGGPRRGIELLWRPGDRERRIRALLRARAEEARLDLDDLVAIQADIHSAPARALIDVALELAGPREGWSRGSREAAAILEDWDGRSDAESRGAAAFHVFQARMLRAVLEPALGAALLEHYLRLPRVQPEGVLLGALRGALRGGESEAPWPEPEALARTVRRSLRDTWITLSVELGANRDKWSWGRLHRLHFEPLRGLPSAWRPRGLGPFPVGGDGTSVQVAEYQPLGGFDVRVVAAYRLVAEAGNLDQALSVLAPGQAGHPRALHATDQLETWLEGRMSLLSTSDWVVEDGEIASLRLEPSP